MEAKAAGIFNTKAGPEDLALYKKMYGSMLGPGSREMRLIEKMERQYEKEYGEDMLASGNGEGKRNP